MATLDSGVVFGKMQLSTDGTTVTQTDSFKDTTAFNQVADLLIESPTRVHALLCGTLNAASGQTVLAAADFSALSISYTQTLPYKSSTDTVGNLVSALKFYIIDTSTSINQDTTGTS